ncbi:ralBP1-associated Eps domain-containing protein 1, partial [Ischnura elegans]|uniref:ralBP1-associated Eps domain-containing protein 1 n=1 Tax=Ischnura elegans TaxID=197161 RepID=UPI001ED89861
MDEGSQIPDVVRKSDLSSCQMGLPAGHTVEPASNDRHCFSSPKGGVSPEASSTASDSPTPTNSAATHWHGLVCEEQRQLLGTEEESSDRHSSEDDGVENDDDVEGADVWKITQEQREYYSAQFRSLQPDPMGLVAGPVARLFFEKSRLPVLELRKIWMLADVSKDGALSLGEFHTAMHLVVLRRNKIELPDSLPPSLVPLPSLSLASSMVPPPSAPHHINAPATAQQPHPKAVGPQTGHHEESPPSLSPPGGDSSSTPQSKEWTKFVDSPTSSVSSPGPKPVNFDFHKAAVEQDPKILHPVPLRITPDLQALPSGNDEEAGLSSAVPPRSPRKTADAMSQEHAQGYSNASGSAGNSASSATASSDRTSPKKGSAAVSSIDSGDIRPIQRPQPKKYAVPGPGAIPPPPITSNLLSNAADFNSLGVSNSGPGSLPVAMSSGSVGVMKSQGLKKEPPPPPPPRPIRGHTRSSSLDLNHLGNSESLIAPPVVPPRISPCMPGFADFTHFGGEDDGAEEGEGEAGEDEEEDEGEEVVGEEGEGEAEGGVEE